MKPQPLGPLVFSVGVPPALARPPVALPLTSLRAAHPLLISGSWMRPEPTTADATWACADHAASVAQPATAAPATLAELDPGHFWQADPGHFWRASKILDRFLDSRAPDGRRTLDVSQGEQRMDGVTAAMYVRSRHGRSDWNRARRQQAVLLGMRHELQTLGGLTQLPSLWDALESSVQTDLRRIELFALARRALTIDPTHLHGLVLGAEAMHGERTSDGRAVLIPDPAAIERALTGLFAAPSPGLPPPGAKCAPKDAALRGARS